MRKRAEARENPAVPGSGQTLILFSVKVNFFGRCKSQIEMSPDCAKLRCDVSVQDAEEV